MIHSESLTTERIVLQKTITTLDMLRNRASFVEINSFSIRFPFDSTFNEVIEKVCTSLSIDVFHLYSFFSWSIFVNG